MAVIESAIQDNIARLRKIYDCFTSGDIKTMCTYMSDDAVIVEVQSLPYAGEYTGPSGLAEVIGHLGSTWDNLNFELEDILASETRAAGFGTFSGTARATGKPVSFKLAEVWTFKDGKVTRCEPIYGDTAAVREACGL